MTLHTAETTDEIRSTVEWEWADDDIVVCK